MIGRVLKSIDEHGLADNTLLIFTSDNGPVWYESDVKRFSHDSSGGLRGMKADAWECGHRMPFVVRWPGKVKAASVSDQTICFTDLLATFASIVDAKLPAEAGPDSFDFSGVLVGTQPEKKPVRDALVIRSGGGVMTIRAGDWKLIQGLGSGGFSKPRRIKPGPNDPPGQLYNLAVDLGETNNLYADEPAIVQTLLAQLKKIRDDGRSRPAGD
jgi:arylsulfatase A-like enzyme